KGKGPVGAMAQQLDHSLCRRRSQELERGSESTQAPGCRENHGHAERREPGTVQCERLPASALPARRNGYRDELGCILAGIEGVRSVGGALNWYPRASSPVREGAIMAVPDIYLKLDGVDGEAQDTDHQNQIEILSFSLGVTNQGSGAIGVGSGSSRANVQDLYITKHVDK